MLKPDGSLTVDDKDTANTLNYFFSSVFTQENADDIPSFETRNTGSSLTHVAITVDVVWKQLCKLKPYKSGGPDNCHPRVLLELKESVVLEMASCQQCGKRLQLLLYTKKETEIFAIIIDQ